ncbi:uncharacterized protein RSE6_11952 [Rhynchosporium secalis]|uniref:WSC domain-containing protein n=1 Tax=Rhynchosporium secalis TaxID=38038 RepID=A0A1E1MP57_RHYSE|nr:uncharacterized protein RSE6_11952 [Rhynchosporium secalis]
MISFSFFTPGIFVYLALQICAQNVLFIQSNVSTAIGGSVATSLLPEVIPVPTSTNPRISIFDIEIPTFRIASTFGPSLPLPISPVPPILQITTLIVTPSISSPSSSPQAPSISILEIEVPNIATRTFLDSSTSTPTPSSSPLSIFEIEIPTPLTTPTLPSSTSTSSTSTSTSTPSTTPTLSPGNDIYVSIGCFSQPLTTSSSQALGAPGGYHSPIFASQDLLTVPLCLEACGIALAPDGSGPYTYAGLENSRECYCGLTLSPLSEAALEAQCSSPCAADPATFCGGYGYLSLYQRRSTLNSTTTAFPPTTEPTPSSTSAIPSTSSHPSPASKTNQKALIIGLTTGLSLLLFFSILLLCSIYILRRRKTQRNNALLNASLKSQTKPSFVGGFALLHPSQSRPHLYPPAKAVHTSDGRRSDTVIDDNKSGAETYIIPLAKGDEESETKKTRHVSAFEEWKSGVIGMKPVLRFPPDSPEAATKSVELDPVVSPITAVSHTEPVSPKFNFGFKVEDQREGYETPMAELPDWLRPPPAFVEVHGGERQGSADFGKPLDNRELERRLKELGL